MDELKDAIKKKALGYSVEEVVEEFSAEEGILRLVKKKVSTKHYPPDLTACKLVMDEGDIQSLTDDELISEKNRLLLELEKSSKDRKNN